MQIVDACFGGQQDRLISLSSDTCLMQPALWPCRLSSLICSDGHFHVSRSKLLFLGRATNQLSSCHYKKIPCLQDASASEWVSARVNHGLVVDNFFDTAS